MTTSPTCPRPLPPGKEDTTSTTLGSSRFLALEGLIAAARKQARRRGQRPSTAHCVLEMLQTDPDAAAVLRAVGVTELALVAALKVAEDESDVVLERAAERARRLARNCDRSATLGAPALVRPIHLLAALASDPRSAGAQCFERIGVPLARVQQALVERLGLGPIVAGAPETTPRSSSIVVAPSHSETRLSSRPTRFPSLSRARRAHGDSQRILEVEAKASKPVRAHPVRADATSPRARVDVASSAEPSAAGLDRWEIPRERFPILSSIGRNLSALAARGLLDPVLARDRELEQLADVLCRRRGNNPLLLGPPGVGKTALVEGLARAIVEATNHAERGPALGHAALTERILVEITPGALTSGTGVRGALAERMKKLREELARADGRVLVFFDEIHVLLGDANGNDELAGELKIALSRGELQCLGASTDAEARKFLDRDPALARRFGIVHVGEPSPAATERILEGLLPRYEAHHGVRYEPACLRAAIELSARFLPERHLPDKAIGALDLAGVRARRRGSSEVTVADVARGIADEARVPVERLLARDHERFLALERHLAERIVGQDRAIARIADALRKGAAGFRGPRPLATFLFLGSTGVGKTECAKAIADLLFLPGAMTRIDMSELSESHGVARLLGAPPGYIGHESGGQLTEAVRRRPYQLVLLDEIEKAHPEVLLALLPLLDEGRLTDARGRLADFTNAVIVMTSNLGASLVTERQPRAIGFGAEALAPSTTLDGERAQRVIEAARRALPPELWNRIDEPIVFEPLGDEAIVEIARRMLDALTRRLAQEHRVTLEVEPSALVALAAAGGFDAALGARPMRRVVGRLVESPLAARILAGEITSGSRVRIEGRGAEVSVTVLPPGAHPRESGAVS